MTNERKRHWNEGERETAGGRVGVYALQHTQGLFVSRIFSGCRFRVPLARVTLRPSPLPWQFSLFLSHSHSLPSCVLTHTRTHTHTHRCGWSLHSSETCRVDLPISVLELQDEHQNRSLWYVSSV